MPSLSLFVYNFAICQLGATVGSLRTNLGACSFCCCKGALHVLYLPNCVSGEFWSLRDPTLSFWKSLCFGKHEKRLFPAFGRNLDLVVVSCFCFETSN